jgi:hypothetical protein
MEINVVDPATFMSDFPNNSERLSALKEAKFVFPTWNVITLGTRKEFKREHKKNGRKITTEAADLLAKPAFTVASEETRIELVKVRLWDMCFSSASLREICDRAVELGLRPCPAEVGPQVWHQRLNSPDDNGLMIAMEAIVGSDGNPYVFVVESEYGQTLDVAYAYPAGGWSLNDEVILCK